MSLPYESPPAPERAAPPTSNGPPSLSDRVRELSLNGRANGAPSRSSSSNWLPWVLCILLAGAWASMGIRWYRSPTPPANAPVPVAPGADKGNPGAPPSNMADKLPPEPPMGEPDALVTEAKGYLIPSHQISISPIDVSGRIINLQIEEGKGFKKGDLLAEIDATPYRAEVKEAEAQLAAAKARYNEANTGWKLEIDQAEAELAEARAQMAEAKLVYETSRTPQGGAVAKLDVGQAARKYEAAEQHMRASEFKRNLVQGESRKQRIEALQKDMQAAEARLLRSQWHLTNCKIVAPVDGIILTKKAEYGALTNALALNSGSGGGVSTGICDMADLSKLEVDLEIQERDIAKIKPGMVCRIRADAWPNRVYEGYYDRAMPIANRARGIVPVRVRVIIPPTEKQGEYLKPEMGVSVVFVNREVNPRIKAEVERYEAEYRASTSESGKPKGE
jgi:multidrug resistance efflux pump